MSVRTCPQCGKEAGGNFCAWCGAALGGRHCTQCGAETEPGARFCNRCGTPLAEGVMPQAAGPAARPATPPAPAAQSAGSGGGNQAAWWVAGATLVALILIVAYPVLRQGEVARSPGASAMAPGAPGTGASAVDLSSMTPRQAADMLFDRVMRAASAGDSAQVTGFLPMSIAAYERARPLDADGFFHMALLQQTGGDFQASLASAREGLEADPDHLLLLAAAAEAADSLGEAEATREYYGHLLDVWDQERAKNLEEYEAHAQFLSGLRQEAQDYLGR